MLKPFFVWREKMLIKVQPEEVVYLFTEKNYTKIVLENKEKHVYMVRSTLLNTLKKLPPDLFIKTHRSYAVSVYYIDGVFKDHLIAGEYTIPIAKQHYKSVRNKLNIIE
jgi:DNA-binding LytR/AlgR family response regulator